MAPIPKSKFVALLLEYAEANKWEATTLENAEGAKFEFETEEGTLQVLYVTKMEDGLVEFDVLSAAVFDTLDDVTHEASTLLLRRNARIAVGYWTLEQIGDTWCYSLMYMTDEESVEAMGSDEFAELVEILAAECEEFEEAWESDDYSLEDEEEE